MAGEVHYRGLPRLRDLDPDLRRRRLVAARRYAPLSIPRIAIMLGQWDAGDVVRLGLIKTKRGKKNGRRTQRKDADSNG
jgi:hypothetical protein